MSAFSNFTITVPVPVAQGGTGAITAAAARTSLGAAASGTNADITTTTALATIQMGGVTNAFPMLVANSNRIFVRLADNSDWATIFVNNIACQGIGSQNNFGSAIWTLVGAADGLGIIFVSNTSGHPALKCAATVLQCRLADDSNFAPLQGLLRTAANATTGLGAGILAALTNASIVITDASGQAYRVPCII